MYEIKKAKKKNHIWKMYSFPVALRALIIIPCDIPQILFKEEKLH